MEVTVSPDPDDPHKAGSVALVKDGYVHLNLPSYIRIILVNKFTCYAKVVCNVLNVSSNNILAIMNMFSIPGSSRPTCAIKLDKNKRNLFINSGGRSMNFLDI